MKYTLDTSNTIIVNDRTLYRIVYADGTLGGWTESNPAGQDYTFISPELTEPLSQEELESAIDNALSGNTFPLNLDHWTEDQTVCVYLGAAIDHSIAKGDRFKFMAKAAKQAFVDCFVYNPKSAFSASALALEWPTDSAINFIDGINSAALKNATVALFEIGDSFSYGLVKEILYCIEHKKPAVIYFSNNKRPGFTMSLDLQSPGSKIVVSEGPTTKQIVEALQKSLNVCF